MNFAMHKIKPVTLTAGPVKRNFKETLESFVASDNAFSFMSSVKGTRDIGNSFCMMYWLWLSN